MEMRVWLCLAALGGGSSVAMGAFAAHGLQAVIPREQIAWVETAALYGMAHALALIGVAWLSDRRGGLAVKIAGVGFALGILLFSGGLYVAALGDTRQIMPVVPLGGFGFLLGWAALLIAALRRPPAQARSI